MAYVDPRFATRYGPLADVGALCAPPSPLRKIRKGRKGVRLEGSGLGALLSAGAREFSERIAEVRDGFRAYRERVGASGQSTKSSIFSWIASAPAAAYRALTDMDVTRASEALRVLYLEMIDARNSGAITQGEFGELRADWDAIASEVRGQAASEGKASAEETIQLAKIAQTVTNVTGLPTGTPQSSREQQGRDSAPKGSDWTRYALLAGAGVAGFVLLATYVHGRGMRSS